MDAPRTALCYTIRPSALSGQVLNSMNKFRSEGSEFLVFFAPNLSLYSLVALFILNLKDPLSNPAHKRLDKLPEIDISSFLGVGSSTM